MTRQILDAYSHDLLTIQQAVTDKLEICFHDCSHRAITRMIQAGFPPTEVMKVSKHTQVNIFARYVNPNAQAVKRIADVLSAYQL